MQRILSWRKFVWHKAECKNSYILSATTSDVVYLSGAKKQDLASFDWRGSKMDFFNEEVIESGQHI